MDPELFSINRPLRSSKFLRLPTRGALGNGLRVVAGARLAIDYAQGETYRGKTSPYWYTSENFFELFQSFSGSVRELIAKFDGCTGRKAGIIAANYSKTPAATLGFSETEGLLGELRAQVKNVNPERLGRIGQLVYH